MAEGDTESAIGATWDTAKAHPWLIGGALAAVVLALWYFGRAKAPATPPQFSFSYGPSDAQVRAGTALAIAQHADTTQLAMAGIQKDVASSYYDYLTNTSDNQAAVQFNHDFYNTLQVSDRDQASIINARTNTDYLLRLNAQQNDLAAVLSTRPGFYGSNSQ